MGAASPATQEFGPCPCGSPRCDVMGTKLTRFGTLVGCKGPAALGRRNKRKGNKANARAHKRLGGSGITVNDDLYHAYSVNHSVEVKTGNQIPAHFTHFVNTSWFGSAIRQAAKKIPVGSGAFPSVCLEFSPSRAYLVTDLSGGGLREAE